MRVPKLKALARERRLRCYSMMRRAALIELIRNDSWNTNTPLQSWEPNVIPGSPIDLCHLYQLDLHQTRVAQVQLRLGNCRPKPDNPN